ncbi:hypothetical protein ACWDBD_35405 [Streptomyces sp. NPDC001118]|uniref:hypothetical protein n=1 Tax=unclassified Streptomyces TaxID=2593676 RepID=UPI00332795DD
MPKNAIKRATITAGLVGAVAFTAIAPAQAAPALRADSAPSAVTAENSPSFLGTIKSFTDNFLELEVDGKIEKFDLTKGAYWYGRMGLGAQAYVEADNVDGTYVAKSVFAA